MISGRDYLPIIECLTADTSSASMRTRIGRCYYAAFLECRAYCERRMGYTRSKMAREHQAIANLISMEDQSIADALKDLRLARNAADYDELLDDQEIEAFPKRAEDLGRFVLDHIDAFA